MRFPFIAATKSPASLMPRLPLTLSLEGRSIEVLGLVDTGAAINLLPYQAGLALGAVWEQQPLAPRLTGALGEMEARQLLVEASHPQLTGKESVQLIFAWTQIENAPVLLGQMNFFLQFNVCFYRAEGFFDIHPVTP